MEQIYLAQFEVKYVTLKFKSSSMTHKNIIFRVGLPKVIRTSLDPALLNKWPLLHYMCFEVKV